ncbi:tryptophan synthase subunit alpha [Actinomadura kijaniata]|uniref:tryptophan synthase subunit alpha n=1 Tax=Actinomadura kijaniata TaxID=46161 RepID=UPI003F1C92FD
MSAKTAYDKARAEGRAALVGYLPAGFPDYQGAVDAARAMVDSGCDVIEIGLPYSDPMMDGPIIQDAVHRALVGGIRLADVFRTVEAVAATGVPTLVMTYYNPVDRYGVEAFARDLRSAGGCGLITPDLSPEEGGEWIAAADAHDLDKVFLVALSSTDERIEKITTACRGFVYAASLMGVTGARTALDTGAPRLVERTRQIIAKRELDLPVGLGLGVSDGAQAAEIAGFADGVIVGSAFVRRLLEAPDRRAGLAAVGELAAELAAGVRRQL